MIKPTNQAEIDRMPGPPKWLRRLQLRWILFLTRKQPFVQGEWREEFKAKYGVTVPFKP